MLENNWNKEIEKAKSLGKEHEIENINKAFDEQKKKIETNFIENIQSQVQNVISSAGETMNFH